MNQEPKEEYYEGECDCHKNPLKFVCHHARKSILIPPQEEPHKGICCRCGKDSLRPFCSECVMASEETFIGGGIPEVNIKTDNGTHVVTIDGGASEVPSSWEEELDKKVNELKTAEILKELGNESQAVDFGYRIFVKPENDIPSTYGIVDFGNIKRFIHEVEAAAEQRAYEEGYVKGQKNAFGVDRERVKNEGKKQAVEEIMKIAENAKVAKEAVKINKLGADYIYLYDLKKDIKKYLSDLT